MDNARHQTLEGEGHDVEYKPTRSFCRLVGIRECCSGCYWLYISVCFFAVGGRWGLINDISSIRFFLSLILPALAWHRLIDLCFPRLSLVNLVIGIIAMITAAMPQAAVVVGIVEFEQSLRPVLAAGPLIGLWLVVNGVLASRGPHCEGAIPRGL